jgi:uncharacterized protein YraI
MNKIYSRLITIALATMLLLGTTGCSVIMGIFGAGENTVNDAESDGGATRILVPTPSAANDETNLGTSESASTDTATIDTRTTLSAVVLAQPTATTISAPLFEAPTQQRRRTVTITGSSVNLRNGPGTNSAVLRTVPAGTAFEFVEQTSSGDWYQICCVDGSVAWVYAELAELGEAPVAAKSGQISTVPATSGSATLFTANPTTADIPYNAPVFNAQPVADGVRYEFVELGFAVTLPSSWQPLDLSETGLRTGLNTFAGENPGAAAVIQGQLQSLINARFSLFAVDLSPTLLTTGYATTGNLLKQPMPAGVSLELYTQITAKETQERFALTTPLSIIPLVLPAGQSVELSYTMSGGAAVANQPLAVTQYLIMQGQTIYAFTFTTTASQADAYSTTFTAIAESFRLLNN